jgi:Na+/melibiose symporter-like transporter
MTSNLKTNVEEKGIYRKAKNWQIALTTINSGGAMCFYILLTYASYVANVGYGIATAVVGFLLTATRIFDGFINPVIAMLIDKTMTKHGKIRLFLLTGWGLESLAIFMLYIWCSGKGHGIILFTAMYLIYILGYTMNNVAGMIAGPVMTNDPKQRPIVGVWGTVYNYFAPMIMTVLFTVVLLPRYNNEYTIEMLAACAKVTIIISLVFTLLACIGVTEADKPENFGIDSQGSSEKVKIKDMMKLLKSNRALQMYIVAGASDKLAQQTSSQSIVTTMLFGILIGNMQLSTLLNVVAMLPSIVFAIFGARYAGKHGSKEALYFWTEISMAFSIILAAFMYIVDMRKVTVEILPTVVFFVITLLVNGAKMCVTTATSSMSADVIDYELARSGKYMPAVVTGTYNFFDRILSSLGAVLATSLIAIIGYTSTMPQPTDAPTLAIKNMTIFIYVGLPIIGWICNLVAMKLSPISKEEMIRIQEKIAEQKAKVK